MMEAGGQRCEGGRGCGRAKAAPKIAAGRETVNLKGEACWLGRTEAKPNACGDWKRLRRRLDGPGRSRGL